MSKHNLKKILAALLLLIVAILVGLLLVHGNKAKKGSTSLTISNLSSSSLRQLPQYANKVIVIKGAVVQIGNDYYVAGTGKSPAIQQLDFSTIKVNPASYVASSLTSYTVTGKLIRTSPHAPFVMQVQSIK